MLISKSLKENIKEKSWLVAPAILSFIATLIIITNITKPYSSALLEDPVVDSLTENKSENNSYNIAQALSNKAMDVVAQETGGCGCPACCSVEKI